jgi:uncharacterized protein with beta-barrel porin domain
VRTDKSFAFGNQILTLRGRFAWLHDFDPNRISGATFQALPGASFVVTGARQADDAALASASAELKWMNGFSLPRPSRADSRTSRTPTPARASRDISGDNCEARAG